MSHVASRTQKPTKCTQLFCDVQSVLKHKSFTFLFRHFGKCNGAVKEGDWQKCKCFLSWSSGRGDCKIGRAKSIHSNSLKRTPVCSGQVVKASRWLTPPPFLHIFHYKCHFQNKINPEIKWKNIKIREKERTIGKKGSITAFVLYIKNKSSRKTALTVGDSSSDTGQLKLKWARV